MNVSIEIVYMCAFYKNMGQIDYLSVDYLKYKIKYIWQSSEINDIFFYDSKIAY